MNGNDKYWLIPANTGNGIIDMWGYIQRSLSVDHWPPKSKDILWWLKNWIIKWLTDWKIR